jgi:hypothetical protein
LALSIALDHAQTRVIRPLLSLAANGLELAGELDGAPFAGTWLDPITHTLMLRPQPLRDAWYTDDTGANAKWSTADFDLGPGWENRYDQSGRGPWMGRVDANAARGGTSLAPMGANEGLWLAWFAYGSGERYEAVRVGWSATGDLTAGTGLVFWSDGTTEVWRDGRAVHYGRISGARAGDVRTGQVFQVMLIPMRGEELLVYALAGNGFSYVLSEGDAEPVTPAGPVWFQVPHGAVQVQLAPLRFATSGFAYTVRQQLSEPPQIGETPMPFDHDGWPGDGLPYRLFGAGPDTVDVSLADEDGNPWAPDGVTARVRLRMDFASPSPLVTPMVRGVSLAYAAQNDSTLAATLDVTGEALGAALSVPDDPRRVSFDWTARDPAAWEAQTGRRLSTTHRPVRVNLGSTLLLDGVQTEYGEHFTPFAGADRAQIAASDAWARLSEATFAEPCALDGLTLTEALEFLLDAGGWSGPRVISSTLFRLPNDGAARWPALIERGDTATDWIARLLETYAADWWWGFRPRASGEPEWFALAPEDLPTTPVLTLAEAREGEAATLVYRAFQQRWIEPDANEVQVTGWDPVREQILQAGQRDAASQDPTLAPEQRPLNWLGTRRRYALIDPVLSSTSAVEEAARRLFRRMSRPRQMCEFRSDLLLALDGRPLWRGDVVELEGRGWWRIRAFGCTFTREEPDSHWRDALYTAEAVDSLEINSQ